MNPLFLRLSGFIAFISGQPRQSARTGLVAGLIGALQRVAQAALVLGVGFVATHAITAHTRSWVDDDAVAEAIGLMIRERASVADAATLKVELSGDLVMAVHNPPGAHGIAVLVGIDNLPELTEDPCNPDINAMPEGSICLFRARPIFPDRPWLANFVSFDFPGSAYTIPHLAIAAASKANPSANFTQSRSSRTRQLIERTLGKNIFLPSSDVVLWGRRVNGPIQALTIWLTVSALIMLLLAWLNSCVQNGIVKRTRRVALDDFGTPTPTAVMDIESQDVESDTVLADASGETDDVHREVVQESVALSAHAPNRAPGTNAGQSPVRVQRDYPTPWSSDLATVSWLDLSDADTTARFYERVSTSIHGQSAFGGVVIDPPVLRLRRAAARAVANTDDTSILPSFLDAQKDSILAFYDARLSLVRFMLWVIPTVGFIGTIIGVSDALSSTIGLQSASDLVAGVAQSSVSASMGMAFDTTLVALLAAVIVMLVFHLVQGAEERMTVLERDQAEAEILELSRSVRKPGSAGDLAQQLILLGVDTQHLVRELGLFQTSGPELQNLIMTLRQQAEEMEGALKDIRGPGTRRNWLWRTVLLLVLLTLIIALVARGFFGAAAQAWLKEISVILTNWLG